MAKSKKSNNKPKLDLTVREEQRNKLGTMASSENRSAPILSRLSPMNAGSDWSSSKAFSTLKPSACDEPKLNADNPADREKFRRAVLDLVAEEKWESKDGLVDNHANSWLPRLMSHI